MLILLAGTAVQARVASPSEQTDQVLLVVFESIDGEAGGTVATKEVDALIQQTYGVTDVNQDGRVTLEEFKAFSMGFEYLAQLRGRIARFDAAKAAIFRRWDANRTGQLTFQDYRAGILLDLTRAAGKAESSDLKISLDEIRNAQFIRDLTEAVQ